MKRMLIKSIKIILFIIILMPILFYIDGKKSINEISQMNRIEIYDKNNNIFYTSFNLHEGNYIKLVELNEQTINIFLFEEDNRFYNHYGFDIYRILKSLLTNSSSGASTITQQYIKNLYLNNERTYVRKLKELYLSIRLELDYNKNDILEGYFNTLYFGHNLYGIYNASKYYFNKEPINLEIDEICILANIIKNPNLYSPILNYNNAYLKRNNLIKELYYSKIISKSDCIKNLDKKLIIYKQKPIIYNDGILYFKDVVLKELKNIKITSDYNQVIKVYTNYDKDLNTNVLKQSLQYDEQSSFICVDKDGYYLSTIGGNNYISSSFNIALYGSRAIASTVKPILYYYAILKGYSNIQLISEKTIFKLNNIYYDIKNFNSIYENRYINMNEALAVSDNMYAVKLHLLLNMKGITNTLKLFNINDDKNIYQAIGKTQMSLNQLVNIYYTFNNNGLNTSFSSIKQVLINNKVKYKNYKYKTQLLNKEACSTLSDKLSSMFEYNSKLKQTPTGLRIKDKLNKSIKGKSGLDDYNSYMIGFTDDYTFGAWCGYMDMTKLKNVNAKALPKDMILECVNSLYKA